MIDNPAFGADIASAFEAGAGFPPLELSALIGVAGIVLAMLWAAWGTVSQLAGFIRGSGSLLQLGMFMFLSATVVVLVYLYLFLAFN